MNQSSAINLKDVLDRIDDDRELLLEIVEIFFEVTPSLLQQLQAAVAVGYDAPETLRLIHELKGAAANLGAEELRRQARLYELAAQQGSKPQALAHFALLLREYEKASDELNQYRQSIRREQNG